MKRPRLLVTLEHEMIGLVILCSLGVGRMVLHLTVIGSEMLGCVICVMLLRRLLIDHFVMNW